MKSIQTRVILLGDDNAFDIAKSLCEKSKSFTNIVRKKISILPIYFAKKAVYCLLCSTKKTSEISTFLYLLSKYAPESTVVISTVDRYDEYRMEYILSKYRIKVEFLSIHDLGQLASRKEELYVDDTLLEKISKHDGHYIMLKDIAHTVEDLQNLHDLGYVLYYPDKPSIKDYIILNPTTVLTTLERSLKDLSECKLESFQPQLDDDLRNILLSMLKEFQLALVNETVSIVRGLTNFGEDRHKWFWSDISMTPNITWRELQSKLYDIYDTEEMSKAMFEIVWRLRRISVIALYFVIVAKPEDEYLPGIYLYTLPNNKIVCYSKSASSSKEDYAHDLIRYIHLFTSRWIKAMLPDFPSSFIKCRIDSVSPNMLQDFQDLDEDELKRVCLSEWDSFIDLNGEPTERFQKWIRSDTTDEMSCLDVKYFLELRLMNFTGDFTPSRMLAERYAKLGVAFAEYHHGLYIENTEKRFEYFQRSADKGQTHAQHQIAICYKHGDGVEKSISQSLVYFEKVFPSLTAYEDLKDLVEIQWRRRPSGPIPFVNAEKCSLVPPPECFTRNENLDPFPCIVGLPEGLVHIKLDSGYISGGLKTATEKTTFYDATINTPSGTNKVRFEIYWNSLPIWRSHIDLK